MLQSLVDKKTLDSIGRATEDVMHLLRRNVEASERIAEAIERLAACAERAENGNE